MGMQEAFADVRQWIYAQHPQYDGWPIQKFAWHYDLCGSLSEIFHSLCDEIDECGEISIDDVKAHLSRVEPPEGYAYVILKKDEVRVGFNVPEEVFRSPGNPGTAEEESK